MTVTEMRSAAEIARDEGVPMEMNPADVLALLGEVERLRAKLAECGHNVDELAALLNEQVRLTGWRNPRRGGAS